MTAAPQSDDLARSTRSTARGGWLRRRRRIAPGPLRLRDDRPQDAGGRTGAASVGAGMLTGALLGLAVLAACTLPFARRGPDPARSVCTAGERCPAAADAR